MDWFERPADLLPLPSSLVFQSESSALVAPPLPPLLPPPPPVLNNDAAAAAAPTKRRRVTLLQDDECAPRDRSALFGERLGRYRALVCGKRCAVPYKLSDIDPSLREEDDELLLVELRGLNDEGWLDDRSLDTVLRECADGSIVFYSLSALRRLVNQKVSLSSVSRSRNISKSLYRKCEPIFGSKLQVTVVSFADFESMPLVRGEALPTKKI